MLRLTRAVVVGSNNGVLFQATKFNELMRLQRCGSESKNGKPSKGDGDASSKAETFILLHNDDGKVIGSRTLKFAQEMATKRKLGLMKIPSPTNKKDWYKLVPLTEFVVERSPKNTKTEVKATQFSVTIGEHDLNVKAKQAAKWISQGLQVNVAVTANFQTTKEQLAATVQRFRNAIADTPHEVVNLKPSQRMAKFALRPSKKENLEKSKGS